MPKKGVRKYVYFSLYLQGAKALLAQIWYGDFYIWGIDAITFLRKSGSGLVERTTFLGVQFEENFWEAKFYVST